MTFYTIVKSKRLSDFLEALSDERLPASAKFRSLLDVWRNGPGNAPVIRRAIPGREIAGANLPPLAEIPCASKAPTPTSRRPT